MKVVFLDVDGVLNNLNYAMEIGKGIAENKLILKENPKKGMSMINKLYPHVGNTYDYFDPDSVKAFNAIMEKTDAMVVVSSAWRKMHTLDELREHFLKNGMKCEDRVIDITPRNLKGIWHRGGEIDHWLKEHPEVTHFVILDDNSDMGDHMPRLVQTTFEEGLQEFHLDMIFDILEVPYVRQ